MISDDYNWIPWKLHVIGDCWWLWLNMYRKMYRQGKLFKIQWMFRKVKLWDLIDYYWNSITYYFWVDFSSFEFVKLKRVFSILRVLVNSRYRLRSMKVEFQVSSISSKNIKDLWINWFFCNYWEFSSVKNWIYIWNYYEN